MSRETHARRELCGKTKNKKKTPNANTHFFINDVSLECVMEYKLSESIQKTTNRRKYY